MTEESPKIDVLGIKDIPSVLPLQEQLRWNQTARDWERVLLLATGGSFAAFDGRQLIGTVTTIQYADLAWIGMMLVDPAYRRRGVGRRLMEAALAHLKGSGVKTIKLDATPAGRPLYEVFGFEPEALIERWERPGTSNPIEASEPVDGIGAAELKHLDQLAFRGDRSALLPLLIADSCVPPITHRNSGGELDGYALARDGSNAFYIGPVVARTADCGLWLLDQMLDELRGRNVYIDVNTGFGLAPKTLGERGFRKQRDLTRMWLGSASGGGISNMIFAIAGPELG